MRAKPWYPFPPLVGYSREMKTTLITVPAPDFPGGRPGQDTGYPSKGKKLGPAWQQIWDRLRMSSDAVDGKELADAVAPDYDLAPATLVGLLSRAALAGVLDKEHRSVQTTITRKGKTTPATRTRTFYRIKSK